MVPTIAPTPLPTQAALIATPIPNNNTLRLPPAVVPPSLSSVRVDDNLPQNTYENKARQEAAPEIEAQPRSATSSAKTSILTPATNTQSGFIAQLISQFSSTDAQLRGLLSEYEKLQSYSLVKYKPSNATQPPPSPIGIIGKILREAQAAETVDTGSDEPASYSDVANENIRASESILQEGDVFTLALTAPAATASRAYQLTAVRNEAIAPVTPKATKSSSDTTETSDS